MEKPKEVTRAKSMRTISRGPSEDTADTVIIQVLRQKISKKISTKIHKLT